MDACFSLLFFRALAAFLELYNRTDASRDRICPPGKLGNIVFPRISARAQISALPRISAHQLSQTSNKHPLRIRPPPSINFKLVGETKKTWFHRQFIHNLKRQRDQQRIIVSLMYQLFLSPCACRVPLCVLPVLLNFVILLRSWQMPSSSQA